LDDTTGIILRQSRNPARLQPLAAPGGSADDESKTSERTVKTSALLRGGVRPTSRSALRRQPNVRPLRTLANPWPIRPRSRTRGLGPARDEIGGTGAGDRTRSGPLAGRASLDLPERCLGEAGHAGGRGTGGR